MNTSNRQKRRRTLKLSEQCNKGLPVITCRCGAQILLLPSVELMSKAIENHVAEHKKKRKSTEAEIEHIRDDLIIQVLTKASEQ